MVFQNQLNKNIIHAIENKFKRQYIPKIDIGDTIKIGILIQEGNKERVQTAEGVVISKNNRHLNTTITIRKIVQNVGVERIYLIHSPKIAKIEVTRKSRVRRAKLYYLRHKYGKNTRLKQKFVTNIV